MLSVVVLASGRGSNFKALIDNAASYRITGLIVDVAECGAAQIANDRKIPVKLIERKAFDSKIAFNRELARSAREFSPDIIALAGFMRILSPDFLDLIGAPVINIHPSLLPNFPGLDTHGRALAAEALEHGCTVHIVDAGVDTGPIIAQGAVPVAPGDDPESLGRRVLAVEHRLYPWVINQIGLKTVELSGKSIKYAELALNSAAEHGFRLYPR